MYLESEFEFVFVTFNRQQATFRFLPVYRRPNIISCCAVYHPIPSVFSFVYELLRCMNFLRHFTNCSRALSRFTGTFEKFVHGHFTGSRALNSCSRALLGVHGQVCSKIFTGSFEMFTGTFLKLFTGTF